MKTKLIVSATNTRGNRESNRKKIVSYVLKTFFSLTLVDETTDTVLVVFLHLSLVVRKPVFVVSDQVPHKPGCTATKHLGNAMRNIYGFESQFSTTF